jgi:hypothetical protein
VRGIGLDQAAQAVDLDVDGAVEGLAVSPRVSSSRRSRFIGRLALATSVLSSANSPLVSGTGSAVPFDNWRAAAVEQPVAEMDDAAFGIGAPPAARAAAAQHGLDAGDQLARVERLAEVIVGAHLEADDAVDRLVARGQHDHRSRLATRAQPPAGGQPVLTRQHQVEDQQLRLEAFEKASSWRVSGSSSVSKPCRPR